MRPVTRYALNDGAYVAYQVLGEGPPDIVYTISWFGHLETRWEDPNASRFLKRLASLGRLILFDKRGTGLSDPVPAGAETLEDWIDDVRAVMDAVDSERAIQIGHASGGPMAIMFAATHPDRTSGLVLIDSFARAAWGPDHPWGLRPERLRDRRNQLLAALVDGSTPDWLSGPADDRFWEWYLHYLRMCASPGTWLAMGPMLDAVDVRPALGSIRVPTLVVHHTDFRDLSGEGARDMASRIPGARFVEVPGGSWFFTNHEAVAAEIEEFLTGERPPHEPERVLATVLFTDIVASTERVAALGDRRWRALLDAHNEAVREQIARHRGREVETAGDAFLAAFDGPARAVRCAVAIRDSVSRLGLELRAGLHTGEVEVDAGQLRGLAVHIGARIVALAGAGEVLVSGTVKDLVAGSGIGFADRGEHVLKGVPDAWRVYAVDHV